MIKLVYANQTERLLQTLAFDLRKRLDEGAHPLEPVELLVPNRNMETWVRLGLAQSEGIAANLRFRRLERFIGNIVDRACPKEIVLVSLDILEAAILAALLDDDLVNNPELQPLKRYLESGKKADKNDLAASTSFFDPQLDADGLDLRRVQLASRMSYLFQEYIFSRPEMIAVWRRGDSLSKQPFSNPAGEDPALASTVRWQRALWQAVFGEGGILDQNPPTKGRSWTTLDLIVNDDQLFENIQTQGLPPIYIFGISYMARLFQLLFARLSMAGNLNVYTLNPCAEFWEDVDTHREYFYRLGKELKRRNQRVWSSGGESEEEEDPFGLFAPDNPALRYWGRPGREHIHLLGELTDCDFDNAFSDPLKQGDTLLHRLQSDILWREPEKQAVNDSGNVAESNKQNLAAEDRSVRVIAAPAVRREVEWVADEIWRLIRENEHRAGKEPLRFSDIAIIVNTSRRDLYLPQIEATFEACQNLPCSISDLPGTTGSRVLEAMNLLLDLPFGRFTRTEMLAFMSHPTITGNYKDLNPDELAVWAEKLGIIFGADHLDHHDTYIDEDVFNWDQGIRRLTLGAFMTGERSGDERIFETESNRWLVEEVIGDEMSAAAQFGMLARSLICDARFLRKQKLTLSEWADFYRRQVETYFNLEKPADEHDRLRLFRTLGKLEVMDLGRTVSGRAAAEIVRQAIEGLEGGRGQYLAEGVVVSTFLPMRAIPFKVVFLLGLGEGLFPAPGQRDALDLRAVKRRAGDVDPAERDRYMFLETLICAREKLYLSYVSRNELTGNPLQPSAVIQELLHILETGYLGKAGVEAITEKPPLRRHDQDFEERETFFDEAPVEARMQKIGHHLKVASQAEPAFLKIIREPQNLMDLTTIETREKLESMLGLPGKPDAEALVAAVNRGVMLDDGGAEDLPFFLSLSLLRRFLECPMQGWAAAMLGMTEIEEDLAEREEEDFEVNRLLETGLLRDVFLEAEKSSIEVEQAYSHKALRMRLAGKIPVGTLGRNAEQRHLKILTVWRELLQDATTTLSSPLHLQKIKLGHSGQDGKVDKMLDSLVVKVEAAGAGGEKKEVPVQISGAAEVHFGRGLKTVILLPKNKPGGGRSNVDSIFRIFLRGMVSQAALAAAGYDCKDEERLILLCYAGTEDKDGLIVMKLKPLNADRAQEWLRALITDLLNGHHAYLLPCDAVARCYFDLLTNSGGLGKGQRLAGPGELPLEELLEGVYLRKKVAELAGNNYTSFSSLWGPVPTPRRYEAPEAKAAEQIALRRFGPLLEDIISVEDLR